MYLKTIFKFDLYLNWVLKYEKKIVKEKKENSLLSLSLAGRAQAQLPLSASGPAAKAASAPPLPLSPTAWARPISSFPFLPPRA